MTDPTNAEPSAALRAPFRLAIRGEGKWVNAYVAKWETMEGAYLLASVARVCAEADPALFEAFKQMAMLALTVLTKAAIGLDLGYIGEQTAPEHERSGNA